MLYNLHKIFDALTSIERRVVLAASVITILTASLLGIGRFYAATTVTPVEGGEYIEGVVGQPVTINPLTAGQNDSDKDLVEIIFTPLEVLLESYKSSEDGKIWTLVLKEELFWSDGEKLTSDDIIFTIQAIQNPETRSSLAASWQGVALQRISGREIKLTPKTPYAFFDSTLKNLRLIPRHIFNKIPYSNFRLSDYNLEPVGSGPYQFAKYHKEKDGFVNRYDLVVNPHYAGTAPLIKKVSFKFYADYDAAIDAFNKKEIDGLGGLDYEKNRKIKIGHQVLGLDMPRYYAIFINAGSNAALGNAKIREALAYATDREELIDSIFHGEALEVKGPIHPRINGFMEDLHQNEIFSTDKAVEILEADGWKLNSDNIREKTISKNNVAKLEFEVIVPQIQFLIDTIEKIRTDWQKIGIRLTPIILTPEEISQTIVKTRNYQMIIFGNVLKNNPDIFSFWHSSERYFPGLNLAVYGKTSLDTLLEEVRGEFSTSSQKVLLEKIQKTIIADKPAIFLYSPKYLYATPKDLGGVNPELLLSSSERFRNMENWYRKTARIFK